MSNAIPIQRTDMKFPISESNTYNVHSRSDGDISCQLIGSDMKFPHFYKIGGFPIEIAIADLVSISIANSPSKGVSEA